MKTGLVLEGGGVRGIYTAGVLDVFLEQGITFDGVIGVSAGAIHACSYLSGQHGRNVVVLTRDAANRKKPEFSALARVIYRRYPRFAKALENRHTVYNETVARLRQLERAGQIFVIRPEQPLDIGRMETDPEQIQRVYDAGRADAWKVIESLKNWLNK